MMMLPDPVPDVLTVKQVADRWRVKYNNPADENYVLACYGKLQFCQYDLAPPFTRLVNYSRDEIIAQVKKECSFMEHYDFVRDLPQYEKLMLRVRKSDLLAFEALAGSEHPERATGAPTDTASTQKRVRQKWTDGDLLTLWNESLDSNATQASLASKYGISRQAIKKHLDAAEEKFSSKAKVLSRWGT